MALRCRRHPLRPGLVHEQMQMADQLPHRMSLGLLQDRLEEALSRTPITGFRTWLLIISHCACHPRNFLSKLPVLSLVNDIRKDRTSPGPSLEDVRQDSDLATLQWMGVGEPQVEEYFRTNNFPPTRTTESLQRSDRQPMAKHAVPNTGYNIKLIIGMQWA